MVPEKRISMPEFNAFGLDNHNVYFSEILVRRWLILCKGYCRVLSKRPLNSGLGLTGDHEVTMYFDKDLNMIKLLE